MRGIQESSLSDTNCNMQSFITRHQVPRVMDDLALERNRLKRRSSSLICSDAARSLVTFFANLSRVGRKTLAPRRFCRHSS